MVFEQVFNFSRGRSAAGASAEAGMTDYLFTAPVEPLTLPPHDPSKGVPSSSWTQDPRIIRDTSPESRSIFDFIGSLTGDIKTASDQQEQDLADPATTTGPAGSTMSKGSETTNSRGDTPTKRPAQASPAPTTPTPSMPTAPTVSMPPTPKKP